MTARYYTHAIPTRVLKGLAVECPRLLRTMLPRLTLSDVSLSRLRIEAFPGIEWSRSLSEMARYIVNRVRPNGETLAVREHMARTQVAAAASQWHRMSQTRRVLQWVISRPPRAYTMLAVRMALGQAQQ
jgi:hypothetical protein